MAKAGLFLSGFGVFIGEKVTLIAVRAGLFFFLKEFEDLLKQKCRADLVTAHLHALWTGFVPSTGHTVLPPLHRYSSPSTNPCQAQQWHLPGTGISPQKP